VRKVLAALYKYSGLVGDKRDIYEEFLFMPHHCPSTMVVEQSSWSAWQLYSVKELLMELQKRMEESNVVFKCGDCLPSHREKLRSAQNTQVSWSYGVIDCKAFHPPIVRENALDSLIVKNHGQVSQSHCKEVLFSCILYSRKY